MRVWESRRTEVGWTVPVAAVTGLAAVTGWLVLRPLSRAHVLCGVYRSFSSIAGSVGVHSAVPPGCSRINLAYWLVVADALASGVVAVGAAVAGLRRAHAASRAGQPWAAHRLLSRGAAWVDRRLPGRPDPTHPRLGAAAFAGLVAVLLLALGVGTDAGWRHHHAAALAQRRQHAEAELATLALPADLTRGRSTSCTPEVSQLCATSRRTPRQNSAALAHLLHGSVNKSLCAVFPGPASACPVTVYGTIAGYPAMAQAYQHLLFVRHGRPPADATPVRPGQRHLFYRGSDVMIGLLDLS